MSLAACALLATPGIVGADAVTDWNEIAAASVAAGRPGPIGQTDLALVAAAGHDAVQAIERRFEPYFAEVRGAHGSRSAAYAAATHGVLVAFYPAQAATLDPALATYLANNGLTGDPGRSVKEDLGLVPLVYGYARYQASDHFALEADALAAPPESAVSRDDLRAGPRTSRWRTSSRTGRGATCGTTYRCSRSSGWTEARPDSPVCTTPLGSWR